MGWTSCHVAGKIDRKEEIRKYFESEDCPTKVLKMATKGSVVYAAVEYHDQEGERVVFATVFLTQINSNDYYNFSYKDLDESAGPFESDCPASILNLLTPTDNQYANEWRKNCRDNIESSKQKKKNPYSLNNLEVGAKIETRDPRTEEPLILQKYIPFGGKRAIWVNESVTFKYKVETIERMGYKVTAQ